MNAARLLGVMCCLNASLAFPQEQPDAPCRRIKLDWSGDKCSLSYQTHPEKASELLAEVSKPSLSLAWEYPTGRLFERADLILSREWSSLRKQTLPADRRGRLSLSFQAPRAGIYRVQLSRRNSSGKLDCLLEDPLLLDAGISPRKAIVEETAETLEFIDGFLKDLRSSLETAGSAVEVYQRMAPWLEKASHRLSTTWHGGTYSLFTDLHSFLYGPTTPPDSPADGPRYEIESILNVKGKPLRDACLRESLALSLLLAVELILEAERLAALPSDDAGAKRRDDLLTWTDQWASSAEALPELDSTGTLKERMARLKVLPTLAETRDLVHRILRADDDLGDASEGLRRRLDESMVALARSGP